MSNSNLFIMYQDGSGNVTMSPRLGTQYQQPRLDTSDTAAQLELLEGSGVTSDGRFMVANVRCPNCQTWGNGGSMSLTSSGAGWVSGWRAGSSLASTSQSESIQVHDDTSRFTLDLTQATIGTNGNPYLSSAENGDDSGSGSDGSGSGSGGAGNGVTEESGSPFNNNILVAHGVIMAITFAALYPIGSFLMPLLGKWWVHAVWQTISFILMWVGFGLGVQAAIDRDYVSAALRYWFSYPSRDANDLPQIFKQAHTILGTVVVCLLVIQPGMGFLHHRYFVNNQRRGVVSYVHIWWGRALLVLGVVNGGLGLRMSMERDSIIIAYGVIAAIVFLVWFAVKGWSVYRRGSKGQPREVPRRPYQETNNKNRGGRYV